MSMRTIHFACTRCKKLKVKCTPLENDPSKCLRCKRANAVCQPAPQGPDRVKKPDGLKKLARVERITLSTQPTLNEQEIDEKALQLERIIQEAEAELATLRPSSNRYVTRGPESFRRTTDDNNGKDSCDDTDGLATIHVESRDEMSVATLVLQDDVVDHETHWSSAIFRQKDILKVLNDLQLLKYTDSHFYFQSFLHNLAPFASFNVDSTMEFKEFYKRWPSLALTMIITARINSNLEKAQVLMTFLERYLIEKILIENQCTEELLKSIFMVSLFIHQGNEPRFSMFFLVACSMAARLEVGSASDCRILLKHRNHPPELVRRAHDRTVIFLAIFVSISAISIHATKLQLSRLLNNSTLMIEALSASPYASIHDKVLIGMARLLSVAQGAQDLLGRHPLSKSRTGQSFEAIQTTLNHVQTRLNEEMDKTEQISDKDKASCLILGVRSCHFSLVLALNESALNQIVFTTNSPPPMSVTKDLMRCILDYSNRMIEFFLSLGKHGTFIPRYIYFRPLFALCALVRLRILAWSLGINDIPIDIETPFAQIKARWSIFNDSSLTGLRLNQMLLKIEMWKNVRLNVQPQQSNMNQAEATDSQGEVSTNEGLQRFLKDIVPLPPVSEGRRVSSGSPQHSSNDSTPLQAIPFDVNDMFIAAPAYGAIFDETTAPGLQPTAEDVDSSLGMDASLMQDGSNQPITAPPPNSVDVEVMIKEMFSQLYRD